MTATPRRFQRLYPPAVAAEGRAYWLLFAGEELLFAESGPPDLLEGSTAAPDLGSALEPRLLGTLDGRPVLFGALDPASPPAGLRPLGLRALLAQADETLGAIAGYAAQLRRWLQISRFCSACGRELAANDGWGRRCPGCGHAVYPPVSPATITLIHDGGDGVLLASKPGWGARYSLIAGFVEPGETLEECVARETLEEVGVAVDDIRYVGSQPWPFPQQLMLGFSARYAGGEVVADASELADARWFRRDALPELPPPFSIARQLIERWRRGEI